MHARATPPSPARAHRVKLFSLGDSTPPSANALLKASRRASGDSSLFSAFNKSTNVCDAIVEEPGDLELLDDVAPLQNRRHRPRRNLKLSRSSSFPSTAASDLSTVLISFRTTTPVHILPAHTPPPPAPPPVMATLAPTDSFHSRVRGTSHIDFKTATTGVQGKAMRNELANLVSTVQDPEQRKVG